MGPTHSEIAATACLGGALLHSLFLKFFMDRARAVKNPILAHLFHHLGEVEIVFGIWALLFLVLEFFTTGVSNALHWFDALNFTESLFVVVILFIASTRPVLEAASRLITLTSRIPITGKSASTTFYANALFIAPLLGSLITEPAAITIAALLLSGLFLKTKISEKLLYSTLATLFVNISIGGTLTSFAAPPILMVAPAWHWDTPFLFTHFGWKAILAIFGTTTAAVLINRKELTSISFQAERPSTPVPVSTILINLAFLALMIACLHQPKIMIAGFILFLDYFLLTRKHQGTPQTRSAILVGFFLASLIILTDKQEWWLKPFLYRLEDFALYGSATLLTAITDNAALTALATHAPNLTARAKELIVSGAVVGGGLTLIANAPNPAGYAILKNHFEEEGLKAAKLFLYAFLPTLIAGAIFWIH